MLGSKLVLSRFAAGLPRISARISVPRTLPSSAPCNNNNNIIILATQRTYATPSRPKKAVGEPSKTVKRAVKQTAASKDSKDSTATPKSKSAKSPKKPVVERTPEDLAALQAKLKKAELTADKRLALRPPKGVPRGTKGTMAISAWHVLLSEIIMSRTPTDVSSASITKAFREDMATCAEKYRNLSAAEREHYNHIASQRTKERAAAYKAWVESYTPDEIRLANIVRRKLRNQLDPEGKKTLYPEIQDTRSPKRPGNSWSHFLGERMASGDFKSIPVPEAAKLIAQEWKIMPEDKKKAYINIAEQEKAEYVVEYEKVYGHAMNK